MTDTTERREHAATLKSAECCRRHAAANRESAVNFLVTAKGYLDAAEKLGDHNDMLWPVYVRTARGYVDAAVQMMTFAEVYEEEAKRRERCAANEGTEDDGQH